MEYTGPRLTRIGIRRHAGIERDRTVVDVDTANARVFRNASAREHIINAVVVRVVGNEIAAMAVWTESIGEERRVPRFDVARIKVAALARLRRDRSGRHVQVQLRSEALHLRNDRTGYGCTTETVVKRLAILRAYELC